MVDINYRFRQFNSWSDDDDDVDYDPDDEIIPDWNFVDLSRYLKLMGISRVM